MKTTKVYLHHPKAAALEVRGEGPLGNWAQPHATRLVAPDTAVFEFEAPKGRLVELKPLLLGQHWATGANESVRGGREVHLYPTFAEGSGQVRTLFPQFESKLLGNRRDISVYLPPGYGENPEKHYPVVYFQDGQNLFESTGTAEMGASWQGERAMDQLLAEGRVPPAIFVAVPHMGVDRAREYSPTPDPDCPSGGQAKTYLRFLFEELKPRIDQSLRTLKDADHTAMVGSSMGGLVSLFAAQTCSKHVGKVAALSPSAWWNDDWLARQLESGAMQAPTLSRLWLDRGSYAKDGGRGTDRLEAAYLQAGLQDGSGQFQTWKDPKALHEPRAWAERLPKVLQFLLETRR